MEENTKVESMYNIVESLIAEKGYTQSKTALVWMEKSHKGAVRKSVLGQSVPYSIHPLTMALHAFSLHIDEDDLIAAILLHDVVEDTPVTIDEIGVNDTVKEIVSLLTKKKDPSRTKEECNREYYEKIGENLPACMVKLLDRCNNVSSMATGFTIERIERYITETKEFVLPLALKVRKFTHKYDDALFIIMYQMESVLQANERLCSKVYERENKIRK